MPEPDLDRLFDSFGDRPGFQPPPAVDIRRRGDRLRRRNRVRNGVAGAVAAAVVVGVPLALVDRGAERTGPPVAPATVVPAPTRLPDDLPRTAGLVPEVRELPNATILTLCDGRAWTARLPGLASDLAAFEADLPVGSAERDIALYPTAEAAAGAWQAVHDGLGPCGEADGPGGGAGGLGGGDGVAIDLPVRGADRAAGFAVSSGTGPVEVVSLVQVGAALVIDRYEPATGVSIIEVGETAVGVQPLVDALGDLGRGEVRLDTNATLGEAQALRAADLPTTRRAGGWTADTDDGSPLSCQEGSFDDLAPSTVLRSRFIADDATTTVRTVMLELAGAGDATQVRETVASWLDDCPLGVPTGGIGDALAIGLPFKRPSPAALDLPDGTAVDTAPGGLGFGREYSTEGGTLVEVAVGQVGDRVVVLEVTYPDNRFVNTTALLRAAADRMVGLGQK